MEGERSGTGRSGSTAWENAVRARLYMRKPESGHSDERELMRAKANYAGTGEETTLRMMYHHGFFVSGKGANEIALNSAKEHMRKLVSQAWDEKTPYTSQKGHPRVIYVAGLKALQQRGVDKRVALQAINE